MASEQERLAAERSAKISGKIVSSHAPVSNPTIEDVKKQTEELIREMRKSNP